MNGRILCLVFVWALCFLSTPAGAEVKTFNQCVKDCTVDQVEGIGQEGADGKHFEHTYRLKVKCVGYFGGNDHLTAERFFVTGQYSPLSQLGWEKIWVLGPGSSERKNAIETSFRCGSDPWRSNSSCANTGTRPTHTSSSDPGYSTVYEVDWSLCHGAAAPISRGGRSKIADAVAAQPAKVSLPAPVIVSPASEEELPNFGPVKVEVKHPPPAPGGSRTPAFPTPWPGRGTTSGRITRPTVPRRKRSSPRSPASVSKAPIA